MGDEVAVLDEGVGMGDEVAVQDGFFGAPPAEATAT
jgi:hypothetical protein